MICKKCGQELSDDSSFCNKCGNAFERTEEVIDEGKIAELDANQEDIVVSNKSRKRKLLMLGTVILGIVILAICSYGVYNFSANRISAEAYKNGVKHIEEVESLVKQGSFEGISKSIDSFKTSKGENLTENDKEFYDLVSNLDMLQLTKSLGVLASALGNKTTGQDVFVRSSVLYDSGKAVLLSKDIKKIKTYNATFTDNFSAMTKASSPKMKIVDGWTWGNEGNYSYVKGSIKNTSDSVITYFKVTAEYLDSSGNVIDTDYTNSGETVKPGNQKEFEIMHRKNSDYDKVRVLVDEVK